MVRLVRSGGALVCFGVLAACGHTDERDGAESGASVGGAAVRASTDAASTAGTGVGGASAGGASAGGASVGGVGVGLGGGTSFEGTRDPGDGSGCSKDLHATVVPGTGELMHCEPDEGCHEGTCIVACDAVVHSKGSIGCEYIAPSPPTFRNLESPSGWDGMCHALLIANTWSKAAQLSLRYDGSELDVAQFGRIPQGLGTGALGPLPATGIPEGQVAVLFLSGLPETDSSEFACPVTPAISSELAVHGTGSGKAFELVSDTPVTVYDIKPYGGAAGMASASLLFPITAWGRDYVTAVPHLDKADELNMQWVLAVASEDNTTITLRPASTPLEGSVPTAGPNDAVDYLIDRGEVLQWGSTGDLAGSVLSASAPIGVYAGNTYLYVPTAFSLGGGGDSAHQQIPHVNALSSTYVTPGIPTRHASLQAEAVVYRLVGTADGTRLSYDPAPPPGAPVQLDKGEFAEFETTGLFTVQSQDAEHPISLTYYMSGAISEAPGGADLDGCADNANCQLGDTDWLTMMPPAQFMNRYVFLTEPSFATANVAVTRKRGTGGFAPVEIACVGQVSGWLPVGHSGQYEIAHVELYRSQVGQYPGCETPQHEAWSNEPFGLVVWGLDDDTSYGYPAGGNVKPINPIVIEPR